MPDSLVLFHKFVKGLALTASDQLQLVSLYLPVALVLSGIRLGHGQVVGPVFRQSVLKEVLSPVLLRHLHVLNFPPNALAQLLGDLQKECISQQKWSCRSGEARRSTYLIVRQLLRPGDAVAVGLELARRREQLGRHGSNVLGADEGDPAVARGRVQLAFGPDLLQVPALGEVIYVDDSRQTLF